MNVCHLFLKMAELTGLEPATSGVTDRRELQLHHSSIAYCTLCVLLVSLCYQEKFGCGSRI